MCILFQDLGWCEDCTGDEFGAAGAEGVDGRLRKVEGAVWGNRVGESVFQGFVSGEEGAGGGDGHEYDGRDPLVEAAEEVGVESRVA